MPGGLVVRELRISPATAAKIGTKHGIGAPAARDLLQGVAGLAYRWDDDPVRGLRALVTVRWGRRTVVAVLYPLGDDVFALGSVYRIG